MRGRAANAPPRPRGHDPRAIAGWEAAKAGIIVGEAEPVGRLKRHPLTRAVRPDKLTIAALAATLDHYLREEAPRTVPVWRMIAAPLDGLQERAERVAAALMALGAAATVVDGESTV